jgi:hypothetical protein
VAVVADRAQGSEGKRGPTLSCHRIRTVRLGRLTI